MKKKYVVIGVIVLVLIISIIYFIYDSNKRTSKDSTINTTTKATTISKNTEYIDYSIKNTSYYDSGYKNRGYYTTKEDGNYIVTIAMGSRSTGGYSIEVIKVQNEDGHVAIYVKETSPGIGDVVTQAFTYPIAQVSFKNDPGDLIIKNLNNDSVYESLNN